MRAISPRGSIGLAGLGLSFRLIAQTTLLPGDVALVSLNANNAGCGVWPAESDEFSFFFFKDVVDGTTLDITDCGYERANIGQWGDTEGLFRITRNGGNLPKGTIVTIQVNGSTNAITTSAGWAVSTTVATPNNVTGNFNMQAGGDQIFFCQGGTWNNPNPAATNNNMTFSGRVLFGFSTLASPLDWVSLGNSAARSGLPPASQCFMVSPSASSDFLKFVAPAPDVFPGYTARSQLQWLLETDDNARWVAEGNCSTFNTGSASSPDYASGFVFPIAAGAMVNGRWTGHDDMDWFDCRNWDDATVPTSTSNVVIDPQYAPVNSCVIGVSAAPPTAHAASITISTAGASRNLVVQNNGILQVTGTITVARTASSGAVGITLTTGTITSAGLTLFANSPQQAFFQDQLNTNVIAVDGNVTIDPGGYLDLQGVATGGTLSLTGSFSNNAGTAAFDEGFSTIVFNGSGPQSINTPGAVNEDFNGLTVNKSGGSDLTLNAPILVKGILTLTSGRLMTSSADLLTLANTSTVIGANDAAPSFIHGPVVKIGNTPVTFTIGKGSRLHPVAVTNITGGVNDAFIAEYFESDPHVDIGWPIESPPLDHISGCEYWKVDQYIGAPIGRVTLGWKAPMSCGVTVLPDLRVAHWDGTMWRDRGNGGAVGSFILGTIPQAAAQQTSFTPGGWWTLASVSAENPLPIELLYFTAEHDGNDVILRWATASERDNDHFTIERSRNGQDFAPILRVEGAGNSDAELEYQERDRWPLEGTGFYRLRQTDTDGNSSVSDVVMVRMPDGDLSQANVLRNGDEFLFVHDFPPGSRIEVLDLFGRAVWNGIADDGPFSTLPMNASAPGTYVARISDGERSASAPFMR